MNLPPAGKFIIVGFVSFLLGIYVGLSGASPGNRLGLQPTTARQPAEQPDSEPKRRWVTDREIRERGPSPLYSESARAQWMKGVDEYDGSALPSMDGTDE